MIAPMRPQKPEIIPADPRQQYRWLMIVALYLLALLWFEPVLDQLLYQLLFSPTPEAVVALNERKLLLASWGYGLLRSLPLLLLLWVGWQITHSRLLPPRQLKLPFSVVLIKGAKAQMIGMGIIALSLLSLLRELSLLAQA